MKLSVGTRLSAILATSALGLAALGGTAFASGPYTAYGHDYKTVVINGTEVAVAADGTPLWNSVPVADDTIGQPDGPDVPDSTDDSGI